MAESSLQQLVENAAFLLALVLVFDATLHIPRTGRFRYWQGLLGLLTGGIGVWTMLTPWQFTPGISFDTRSVLLSISGLFFGLVPTAIAMVITSALRIYQGGAGAFTGVCVIFATGSLGILWRRFGRRPQVGISWQELYLFGLITHLLMLALMLTLPWQTALTVLSTISLPILLIYPLVCTMLGLLMVDRLKREQTSKEMRESEKKFRLIVETAREGIWIIDQHGRTSFVNQEMAQMLGYAVEEMDRMPINSFIFENDLLDHALKMDERRHGLDGRYQRRFCRRDGSECWTLVSASPMLDIDGRFSGSFGMVSDISTLKQTKKSLEKSEAQYRVLTESIKDVVWILDAQTLCYRYVSPSVERLRGYTPDEVIARPVYDALSAEASQYLSGLIRERADAFLNGQAAPDIFYTDELEQPCKDGSRVWTESITNYYLNPENCRVELRGVTRDISERKQTDEIVKNSQQELQRLLLETERSRRRLLSVVEEQLQTEDALQKSTEELRVAYDYTLQGWSNALEMRERETAGHSQRVVSRTLELARVFEIPENEIVHIQRGALLHDIGKMGIPDSILLKPGPLTDDEWAVMRQHPEFAYRLLSNIPFLAPALEIPYCHHEKWDGTGYPRGLAGKDIPLAARIFAVVDVWDALSFDRPYREAWPEADVPIYLKENSGTQFDPAVVEVFIRLVSTNLPVS